MGWVEEEEAVRMRCCGLLGGGWVGGWRESRQFVNGWVGGWVGGWMKRIWVGGKGRTRNDLLGGDVSKGKMGGWVGGWESLPGMTFSEAM